MRSYNKKRFAILSIALLFTLIFPVFSKAAPFKQSPTPESRAIELLETLSPEERVGQLFIINFEGNELVEGNPLHTLITKNHIGGVNLKRENDNFDDQEDILKSIWDLNQAIQNAELVSSSEQILDPFSNEAFSPAFIPLFIGISQDGGGVPNDQILSGLSPQASSMAIGATWNPELAYQTGKILGDELEILGFNLLFGPSLNVLENPRPENAGDLGTRSYGGNPYWVGQMGSAYISGIHEGSERKILVVANHFPGLSSPDRPPDEEIPTVLKTQEQIIDMELIPFFAVTEDTDNPESLLDAMLLANAKYEAFQGDISTLTNPISLDAQAFSQLIELPQFLTWRKNGGLIITDELGSRAIRRFEDSTEQVFNYRLVAMTAFLAGNDLLNLGDFSSSDDPDSLTTIRRTLDNFALKYREDVLFQQRVDAAVFRILVKKFELYDGFYPSNVFSSEEDLQLIGQKVAIPIEIASQAITLLSPTAENLYNVLPTIPGLGDQVVIFTDTYQVQQCSTCELKEIIPIQSFQNESLRLHGPEADGQIWSQNMDSYSFENLENLLDGQDNPELSWDLLQAEWVVFLTQDIDPTRSASTALRRFLSERPDLIQDKYTIVFSLDAPYYLDATDISNITAYYGLYSSQSNFVEIAVRLLFKELSATSASPVSVAGIGYELSEALSPNPDQIISLTILPKDFDNPDTPEEPPANSEEILINNYQVNETILLGTSVILDNNGNPVTDNTVLNFVLTSLGSESISKAFPSLTKNGLSQVSIVLDSVGSFEIQVQSGDPPAFSEIVKVEVSGSEIVLEPIPSVTETIIVEPSETPELIEPPLPITAVDSLDLGQISEGHWLLLLIVNLFTSLFAYQLGATTGRVRWGVRWALAGMIGGLIAISYLSFGMDGSEEFIINFKLWGIVILTIVGALVGWAFGWLWFLFASPKK